MSWLSPVCALSFVGAARCPPQFAVAAPAPDATIRCSFQPPLKPPLRIDDGAIAKGACLQGDRLVGSPTGTLIARTRNLDFNDFPPSLPPAARNPTPPPPVSYMPTATPPPVTPNAVVRAAPAAEDHALPVRQLFSNSEANSPAATAPSPIQALEASALSPAARMFPMPLGSHAVTPPPGHRANSSRLDSKVQHARAGFASPSVVEARAGSLLASPPASSLLQRPFSTANSPEFSQQPASALPDGTGGGSSFRQGAGTQPAAGSSYTSGELPPYSSQRPVTSLLQQYGSLRTPSLSSFTKNLRSTLRGETPPDVRTDEGATQQIRAQPMSPPPYSAMPIMHIESVPSVRDEPRAKSAPRARRNSARSGPRAKNHPSDSSSTPPGGFQLKSMQYTAFGIPKYASPLMT
ncbi:hypothetical protein CYMTET_24472 [Cymbomonas tetramitiformis]|uniref:Uncharacterized protein n=1 Tax=Cymbomonas tetramitiformis TaxID=36881 RepID=A0AAE0FWN1_9CHLO|nr:hypothetical protein CYMTET_24472 [Cymbomonas tetramitiformis]